MKRSVRIRRIVRKTIRYDVEPRVPCRVCRRDVAAVTLTEACLLLRLSEDSVNVLIRGGLLHVIATPARGERICRDSLSSVGSLR